MNKLYWSANAPDLPSGMTLTHTLVHTSTYMHLLQHYAYISWSLRYNHTSRLINVYTRITGRQYVAWINSTRSLLSMILQPSCDYLCSKSPLKGWTDQSTFICPHLTKIYYTGSGPKFKQGLSVSTCEFSLHLDTDCLYSRSHICTPRRRATGQ